SGDSQVDKSMAFALAVVVSLATPSMWNQTETPDQPLAVAAAGQESAPVDSAGGATQAGAGGASQAGAGGAAQAGADGAAQAGAGGATQAEPARKAPSRPKLRAGLNERQMAHAVTIVETGQEMGLPRRAYVVAIATALQESGLRVLANVNVPESFDYYPRDGYGSDHESIGIFQQRRSIYAINDVKWSMDPRYSAIKFYNGLKNVAGWESMSVAEAAQAVQVSAFPDAYAKHEGAAEIGRASCRDRGRVHA